MILFMKLKDMHGQVTVKNEIDNVPTHIDSLAQLDYEPKWSKPNLTHAQADSFWPSLTLLF